MTIFTRIADMGGHFKLETSSQMPAGERPVEITGPTAEAVMAELAKQLGTDEEIVIRGAFPAFDVVQP